MPRKVLVDGFNVRAYKQREELEDGTSIEHDLPDIQVTVRTNALIYAPGVGVEEETPGPPKQGE